MREDWIECELGDLLKLKNGFAFQATNYKKEGIPVFRIGDINDWIVSAKNSVKIEEKEVYDEYTVEAGDILIAMSGATTGKFGIYHSTEKAYQNQRVGNLKLYSENSINKSFVFYLLYSLKRDIERDAYGGAQPNISGIKIEALKTKLAPLPIQRAIVSKIEALFSDLDNGIANFKKAQEQLKTYRQAVLKKAFEGGFSITNEELRITDSIMNYELEIKNEENQSSDNLPKGWKWVKLKDISELITDGDHQAPPKSDQGIPFITISNVNKTTNEINFDNTFKVKSEYYYGLKEHRKPKKGDILYTVTGSFGIPIIIDFEKEFCFQRHIGLIRPLTSVNQKYLYYLLQTKAVFNQASETATGTAQKTVALSSLRNFTIPYCDSLQEQTQIVQEIESCLSVTDNLEFVIRNSIEKAEALRQSILKKAFEGKLLSKAEIELCKKETDYEPASELLKKITNEKKEKITNEKLRITKKSTNRKVRNS